MPRRLEMRSTGEQHQEGSRGCLVKQETKQFQSRRVRPVEVFQNKEDRLTFGKFQEDRDDAFKRLLPLSLGRKMQWWIGVFRYGE